MPLELQESNSESDFDIIVPLQWEAFDNPPDPWITLFFPILGTGPNARAEAIRESKERQWHSTKEDPTC